MSLVVLDSSKRLFKSFKKLVPILAIFTLFLLLFFSKSEAKVVERIVAIVNNRVITLSMINAEIEIKKNDILGNRVESGEDAIQEKVLWELIDRILIINEAEKFGMGNIPDTEITEAVQELKQRYPTEAEFEEELAETGMDMEDLKMRLKEQIVFNKFVDQRIRFFARVSDAEINSFYNENRLKFNNKPFSDVREEIESILTEKKTFRDLAEYINKLRLKAEIRINTEE